MTFRPSDASRFWRAPHEGIIDTSRCVLRS
jgi:hypothetical protein